MRVSFALGLAKGQRYITHGVSTGIKYTFTQEARVQDIDKFDAIEMLGRKREIRPGCCSDQTPSPTTHYNLFEPA